MKGDLLIHVECLYPERLLHRAMARGARFRRVRRTGRRAMTVEAMEPDARILLNLCRSLRISAKVASVCGKPVRASYIRSRITLLAAAAVFCLICALVLSRVWLIDIRFAGPNALSGDPDEIARGLHDLEIRPGMSGDIDAAVLSSALEAELAGYSFVSLKQEGIRLLVEAAPEIPEPSLYDIGYSRDLYASYDGIVESVEVRSGIACVSPGDIVKRGQLLIRGEERSSDEETRGIGALGDVFIRTWYEGLAALPLCENRLVPTGRVSRGTALRVGGIVIPIESSDAFENHLSKYERLPIVGLYLPVEIIRETRQEVVGTAVRTDAEALSQRLCALAMADAAARLTLSGPDEYKTERIWIRYENSGADTLSANAVYEIYTNAAVTKSELLQGG